MSLLFQTFNMNCQSYDKLRATEDNIAFEFEKLDLYHSGTSTDKSALQVYFFLSLQVSYSYF